MISVFPIMPIPLINGEIVGWFNQLVQCNTCLNSQPCRDWQETERWIRSHKCVWKIISTVDTDKTQGKLL